MRWRAIIWAAALFVPFSGSRILAAEELAVAFLSEPALRWALASIESGHLKNPDHAQGAAGEVSRFQILPRIWRQYSASRDYKNPQTAWIVAQRILQDRQDWFYRATGRQPSPFDLYVMWNKPSVYERVNFDRRKLPDSVRARASRFENLVRASM